MVTITNCKYEDLCTSKQKTKCTTCKNYSGKKDYYEPIIQITETYCNVCGLSGEHCLIRHASHDAPDQGVFFIDCKCSLCSIRY